MFIFCYFYFFNLIFSLLHLKIFPNFRKTWKMGKYSPLHQDSDGLCHFVKASGKSLLDHINVCALKIYSTSSPICPSPFIFSKSRLYTRKFFFLLLFYWEEGLSLTKWYLLGNTILKIEFVTISDFNNQHTKLIRVAGTEVWVPGGK